MEHDIEIDARGLLCPLPVLRARKILNELRPGTRVLLIATDAASWLDVPHFCAQAGHILLSAEQIDKDRRYVIQRGPGRPDAD
ncbi:sulfurtransferase TusA family protein [Albirhodobacter sp. R86504]|jgi:tRNA 2-thiouridine synthesizing protein A|uniref:sulfurtransferase TusA family protein n=1 Tax=Albirhodobacter sp. R86504 TaxID=3093848 RepID=UPI003670591D